MRKFTGFSQLIKVHECQDTITSHHKNQYVPSKSELSEYSQRTVIIDLTENQVEQMMICFPGGTPIQK